MFPEKSASSRRVLKCQHSSERLFPDAQHSAERSHDEGQEQEDGDTMWDCQGVSVRVEEGRERGEKESICDFEESFGQSTSPYMFSRSVTC